MDKDERVINECLTEMFKRVGEKYPNKLTKKKDWFTKRKWSEEDQEEFSAWMKKKMKKEYSYMTKHRIDNEVGMFLLMWGWSTSRKEGGNYDRGMSV